MASNRLHVFRINARELLRRPGLVKHVGARLPASELGVVDRRITGDVEVDVHAVSGIDGIAVNGSITMPWTTSCRRCLTDVSGVAEISVDEIYQADVESEAPDVVFEVEGAFEIEGDRIDLVPVIREHLLLELPDDQLCREECAGLCPVCGADRNTDPCDCDTSVRDERWAVLDELRFDEN